MVDNFSGNFQNFLGELSNITSKGQYSVAPKLKPVQPKTINIPGVSLPGGTNTSLTGSSLSGGDELTRLMRAIRSKESSNNYYARNKDSGAAGAYQIMPFNFEKSREGWDWEALGRDVSYNEFINSPAIQDAIAKYKLGQYLKQYGAAGAAVAWYGGPGAVKNMNSTATQTGGYPSIYAYWNDVLSKM